MQTTLSEAGPFEQTLTIAIDDGELEEAKNRAARKLSHQLKVKGFRPGKAPRRIVESMVGADRLRSEALDEALPAIVVSALRDAELEPAVLPSITATRDTEGGVEVDVRITMWPTLESIPEYRDRRIVVDSPDVTDEEVDVQVDRLREQFAELEESAHPAQEGDFVMIDLSATRGGEPVDEASATDLLYEVGSNSFLPGLDEPLLGSGPGDIKQFDLELPAGLGAHGGTTVAARVLVKGVRTKRLPELTDEWVEDVTEFETIGTMQTELRSGLERMKLQGLRTEVQQRLIGELDQEMDLALPEALVTAEMETIVHRFAHELESRNVDLQTYLGLTGQAEDDFVADIRSQAERNLRARILLEAIAAAEGVEVADEEIDATIEQLAGAVREDVAAYRAKLEEAGQVESLAGDILRRKTVDLLVEVASPVDPDGNPVTFDAPVEASAEPADQPGVAAEAEAVVAEVVDAEVVDAEVVDAEVVQGEVVPAEVVEAEPVGAEPIAADSEPDSSPADSSAELEGAEDPVEIGATEEER